MKLLGNFYSKAKKGILFLSTLVFVNLSNYLSYADNAEGKLDLSKVDKFAQNVSKATIQIKKPVYIAIAIIVILQLIRLIIGILQADDDHDRKIYKDGLKKTFGWVIGSIAVFELGVAVISWIFGISITW